MPTVGARQLANRFIFWFDNGAIVVRLTDMNAIGNARALEIENTYYTMVGNKHSAQAWHDMAMQLERAADQLRCVDATSRKEDLRIKADDCHETSRRVARGSHEIFPRSAEPV